MTLSLSQLREQIAVPPADIALVGNSVVRFVRRAREKPFAVYYFDISYKLPSTDTMLAKYQERILGNYYFDEEKSLQWNNYLYFIVDREQLSDSANHQAIELIEQDRQFARKFVIAEEDIASVLNPTLVAPSETPLRPNILSTWTSLLIEAGLDEAVFLNADTPTRLELIESSKKRVSSKARPSATNSKTQPALSLRSLELIDFRKYPRQRNFTFGKVNLIFGANGSGKTSLLEAIELFYCGRNRRNSGDTPTYSLRGVDTNNQVVTATSNRKPKEFRDRNLLWYGQPEIKTNQLCNSFAQFSFLDTDAAIRLTDLAGHFDDDLSKLLVGPDASKIWDNMGRLLRGLDETLRGLRPLESQIKEELAHLEARLQETKALPNQSRSIKARLLEIFRRHRWVIPNENEPRLDDSILEPLSELIPLAKQAASLEWVKSPASMEELVRYCHTTKIVITRTEPNIVLLDKLEKNQTRLNKQLVHAREAIDLIETATRIVDANILDRVRERKHLQDAEAALVSYLSDVDLDESEEISPAYHGMTVEALAETALTKRSAAESALAERKLAYSKFTKQRAEFLTLSQELRRIASRILQAGGKSDECPLCHTHFETGELAKHLNIGVDQDDEAVGQSLLRKVQEAEISLKTATTASKMAAQLKTFCERTGFKVSNSVRATLAEVVSAKRTLLESQSKLDSLTRELLILEARGLSAVKLEQIATRLSQLEFAIERYSRDELDRLHSDIQNEVERISNNLAAETQHASELERHLETALSLGESDVRLFQLALSRLKERVAVTEAMQAKLSAFAELFPWPSDRPLAEYSVEAESTRKVALELQTALLQEKNAQTAYSESIKRKSELDKRLRALGKRIERLEEAKATLDTLTRHHSLEVAMQSALSQNRRDIEKIFLAIHSPSEFKKIGNNLGVLIRKSDDSEANLSRISTGQRAAYALSIFLAQNAQLSLAPPVILMDDPIAHIDDLNVLSFLDYLREIALKGRRQIYLATANDKLAALFERKFDFLGPEDFRRIELARVPQAVHV